MAAVFSMQGAGQFAAALVALITTIAFKKSFINTTNEFSSCDYDCQLAGDRAWRIIVGFGAVPACFALYYRYVFFFLFFGGWGKAGESLTLACFTLLDWVT